MKTSVLAFYMGILAPLAASSALPEFKYPSGVIIGDYEAEGPYPGASFEMPGNDTILARSEVTFQKRANHQVYLCNNAPFQQPCVPITAPAGVCVPLGSDLEDEVSSVGPSQGAYCRFFHLRNCQFGDGLQHFDSTYPGHRDLGAIDGGRHNDRLSSYQCFDL